jgi:hypothetical protein
MRCWRRFGKAFLRGELGGRHLTEGRCRKRARDGRPSTPLSGGPERDECEADQAEWNQEETTRTPRSCPCGRHDGGRRDVSRTLDRHATGLSRFPCSRSIGARSRVQGMNVCDARGGSRSPDVSRRRARSTHRRRRRGRSRGRRTHSHSRRSVARRGRDSMRPATRPRRHVNAPHRRFRWNRSNCGDWRRGSLRRHRLLSGWLRGRGRLRRTRRWEERQGIDVSVRINRQANAQVDVRFRPLGLAARTDRADDVALGHLRADPNADRAEVDERDRPAVRSANRQA